MVKFCVTGLTKEKSTRKKEKDPQVSDSFKFKKTILFEFLKDLNFHIFSNDMNGIKEILIKKIKVFVKKQKAKNLHNFQSESDISTSHGSTDKGQIQTKELFYGLFNPTDTIKVHLENLKKRIHDFNNKTKDTHSRQHGSSNSYTGYKPKSERMTQSKKKTIFQKNLYVHRTHFSQLLRKVLFEKFQKMGIWVRQSFSQDNKKIFLLLKLQGRRVLFCLFHRRPTPSELIH